MSAAGGAAKSLWLKAVPLVIFVLGIFVLVTHLEDLGWLGSGPVEAPDFSLPLIDAEDGDDGDAGQMHLAALRGKPLLVNFWASWCAQCKEELPLLRTLGGQAKSTPWRGELLGISTGDELAPATAAVAHDDLPYKMAFDAADEVSKRYGISGLPHTLLIDEDGLIVKRYARVLTAEDLPAIIAHLR